MTKKTNLFLLFVLYNFVQSYCIDCSLISIDEPTLIGNNEGPRQPNAYTSPTQVADHFNPFDIEFHSLVEESFKCVDSRGPDARLSTPGGDVAELILSGAIYFNETGIAITKNKVRSIVNSFMFVVSSLKRPLFFHSDTTKTNYLLNAYNADTNMTLTNFPDNRPLFDDIFLRHFTSGYSHGCGHIRLMLENPREYGFENRLIVQYFLESIIEWWWDAPYPEKKKFEFEILQGPLEGKAVVVVKEHGKCPNHGPGLIPQQLGSSVFVYHPESIIAWRTKVLVPFFETYDPTIKTQQFLDSLNNLANVQLSSTLKLLPPANGVDIYSVTCNIEYSGVISKFPSVWIFFLGAIILVWIFSLGAIILAYSKHLIKSDNRH